MDYPSAIIGALVGGLMTYLTAIKKLKYESRRDAYLAFLDLRIKGNYPIPGGRATDLQFIQELLLAQNKIDLIGSERIKEISLRAIVALYPNMKFGNEKYKTRDNLTKDEIVIKLTKELDVLDRWKAFENICDNELKPVIQKELESRWQFWKRGQS